jgi:hypothetical protein
MLARRVHAARATAGLAGLGSLPAPALAPRARPDAAVDRVHPTASAALLVPVATVGTLAASGVHLAMFPPHLRERASFGIFFVACSLGQLAWAERARRRPTVRWLLVGALANAAVVALWAVTRTAGLPFGLLPEPEAVGAWDLACIVFETTAVGACLAGVRRPPGGAGPVPWPAWHPVAHAWAALAVTVLVLLSVVGGGH